MTKKIKAAITVAAIAGTCALSSPSFAAWESDSPSKLDANIQASVNAGDEGLMAVGGGGKVFHITDPSVNAPSWTQVYPPSTDDFIDVIADNPGSAAENDFVIMAKDGRTFIAETATGSWTDITNPLFAVLGNERSKDSSGQEKGMVGLAAVANDRYVAVTNSGALVGKISKATNWIPNGSIDLRAGFATDGFRGVVKLDENTALVFGHSAEGADGKNLAKVTVSGEISTWSLAEKYKVANCPNINAVTVTSAGIFVAGDNGKVVKLASDLSDVGDAAAMTASDTAPSLTETFNAVAYNTDGNFGYVAGSAGKMYRIDLAASTHKLKAVASTGTTKDLNALAMVNGATEGSVSGLYRTFASGDDGTSIYTNEGFWNDMSQDGKVIATDGTAFYVALASGEVKKSSDAGKNWSSVSTSAGTAIGNGKSFSYLDGTDKLRIVATGTNPSEIFNLHEGGATKYTLNNLKHFAVDDGNGRIYATASDSARVFYADMGSDCADMATQSASLDTQLTNGGDGMAATSKGIYFFDGGKIKALVDTSNYLDLIPDESNKLVEVARVMAYLSGIPPLKIFESTAEGEFCVVGDDGGEARVCWFSDSGVGASDDVTDRHTAFTGVSGLPFPGGATSLILGINGRASDFTVTTATKVYRYTSSGRWNDCGNVPEGTELDSITNALRVGSKFFAVGDNSEIAYSEGGNFFSVGSDNFPVSATINSAFNATESNIYAAGQDGLVVKGYRSTSSGTTWYNRYTDKFFGARDFKKITGVGDKRFVAYGESGTDLAWMDRTDHNWTAITVGAGDDINTLNDIQPLDAETLYVANSQDVGLVKGVLSGNEITYTDQIKSGSSSSTLDMPEALTALSVVDADNIYAVSGTKLYKFSDRSGDEWEIANVAPTDDAQNLTDIVALSVDKVYAVGENGYALFYDGTETKVLPKAGDSNFNACWAGAGFLYATDGSGNIHTYNEKTKAWTTEDVAAETSFKDITGSIKHKYLMAVGSGGATYLTTLAAGSDDSGDSGAAEETYVTNITGDSAVVNSEVPKHIEPEALASAYNTPPEMAVVCDVQEFTTTGGVADGSTHTFTFNFTPTSDYAFNDVVLYKLKSDGTNLTYNRVSAAPASPTSGDFWITTTGGDPVGAGQTLTSGTAYSVCFAIEDNSQYDNDSTPGKITDPAVLGTSSGSGSSGCVFNPTQTFGMEWLMLAFAPVAAFFRSRFKK